MYSCQNAVYTAGFPIQISTDLRSLTPPRCFSQRATSFFASWCLGIRPSPLRVLRICTVMNILFFYLFNEPSICDSSLYTSLCQWFLTKLRTNGRTERAHTQKIAQQNRRVSCTTLFPNLKYVLMESSSPLDASDPQHTLTLRRLS